MKLELPNNLSYLDFIQNMLPEIIGVSVMSKNIFKQLMMDKNKLLFHY